MGAMPTNLWPVMTDPTQIDQILANLCINARDAISGVGKMTIETDYRVVDEAYCRQHTGFVPGEYVLLAVSDDGMGMDKERSWNIFLNRSSPRRKWAWEQAWPGNGLWYRQTKRRVYKCLQ